MCSSVLLFVGLCAIAAISALPAKDELMFDVGDDTAVVESTVREARAAPEHIDDLLKPGVKEAFLHTYGDDENADGDAQGYRKRSSDKGSDGYKHFDSYHKKDGDKYGYETASEFGQENKAKAGGGNKKKKNGKKGSKGAETKKSYKVVEDGDANKKGQRAVEYEGDSGYYADSGEGGSYSEGDAESESYGYEGEGEGGYEGEGDGESYSEYDEEADEGDY